MATTAACKVPAAPPGYREAKRLDLRQVVRSKVPELCKAKFPIDPKFVNGDANKWLFLDQVLYDLRDAMVAYEDNEVVQSTRALMATPYETDFPGCLARVALVSACARTIQPGAPCHAVIFVRDIAAQGLDLLVQQVEDNIGEVLDAYIAETVARHQTRHPNDPCAAAQVAWNDADGPYGRVMYMKRTAKDPERTGYVNYNPYGIVHKCNPRHAATADRKPARRARPPAPPPARRSVPVA